MGSGLVFLVVVLIVIAVVMICKNRKPKEETEPAAVKVDEAPVKKHPLQGSILMDRFNNKT